MKKFLTVLLVIAVMFTFSFGSAFAYTLTDATKVTLQETAQDALTKALNKVDVLRSEFVRSAGTVTVSYDGVSIDVQASSIAAAGGVLDEAIEAIKDVIIAEYNDQVKDINSGSVAGATLEDAKTTVKNAINGAYATYATVADVEAVIAGDADLVEAAVEAEVEAQRADALKTIEAAKATLGQYSTELPKFANITYVGTDAVSQYKSDAQIAEAVLAGAEKLIKEFDFDEATATDCSNAITFWFDAVAAGVTAKDADGVIEIYYNTDYITATNKAGATLTGAIATAEDVAEGVKGDAELIAYYQAKLEGEVALQKADVMKSLNDDLKTYKNDKAKVAKIKEALARIDADFAAYIECGKANIGYAVGSTAIENAFTNYSYYVAALGYDANYAPSFVLTVNVDTADLVDDVEELAAKKLAATGLNGEAVYDAEDVADNLADDIEDIYTGVKTALTATRVYNMTANEDVVKAEMDKVLHSTSSATTVTFDKVVYPRVDQWTVNTTTHDYAKRIEAKAVISATKAAIRAAKTVADVDAAFIDGYKAFDAVLTLEDLADFQDLKTTEEQIAKYDAKLEAVLVAAKADYGQAKFAKDFDVDATSDFVDNLVDEYLETVYDVAGLEAGYAAAVAEIENLKTEAELKAEVKAINDEILALGKKALTVADEAAYLALVDRDEDLADYVALIDADGSYTTYGVESTLKTTMQNLVKDELDAAYKAIGTVTVEDEAAIDALDAQVTAYNENYDASYAYGTKTVGDLYNALTVAKIDAVEKAIGTINANANDVDAAAVAAARAAYDELAEDGLDVDAIMYSKLIALETTVALQAEKAEAAMIKDVEALKITARSSAKKGSITVKWSVEGNTDAVEGYEIWKSTKKNSGFKKAFTTEKMSYKNTKGLKKGTKYFYKVRAIAYTAEGEKVKSDWSNKAYRVAK